MHRLLTDPSLAPYEADLGRLKIKRAVEDALDCVRRSGGDTAGVVARAKAALDSERRRELAPAINATGILNHTNLGRAPLAAEAIDAVAAIARGYSNLEYDLPNGVRGSRYAHVAGELRDWTGAQDALIVNNCAAAMLLIVDTFAKGRETIVARGELVEIGGGFRIPDVLARAGAELREVGTTNQTHASDYERALSPRTALLLRVHPSNYRIEGYTGGVSPSELVGVAHRAGVLAIEDLGSGAPVDMRAYGLPRARTMREAIADGMDLVACSGDKLIGGPQCGIVAGRTAAVARLRANPLLRALRVDKMTLAALGATLRLHRDQPGRERIPLYRMLAAPLEALRRRGRRYVEDVAGAEIVDAHAYVGAGALPESAIASIAVAVSDARPDALAQRLRRNEPPIVARVADGRLLIDLRTVAPEEDGVVIAALLRR